MSTSLKPKTLRKARKDAERKEEIERKQKFISLIEKRTPLWNKKSNKCKNRAFVRALWEEVAAEMEWDVETCKRMWKNLVDQFRNNFYDAVYGCTEDGEGDIEESLACVKWAYFKQLLFLRDVFSRRTPMNMLSSHQYSEQYPEIDVECIYSEEASSPISHGERSSVSPDPESSTSNSLQERESLERPDQIRPSKRPRNNASKNELMLHLLNEMTSIKSHLKTSATDTAGKFADYVAHLMREVPVKDRRRCEMSVIQVIHSYLEGLSPSVVIPVVNPPNMT